MLYLKSVLTWSWTTPISKSITITLAPKKVKNILLDLILLSSCLLSLASSSWSLALASLSSIISFSNRWIYSTDELEEAVVTREEEGLMQSPFTILDFFLNTKFEISSCIRGIALGSWQWSTCTLRIFSYHLKERKKQTIITLILHML